MRNRVVNFEVYTKRKAENLASGRETPLRSGRFFKLADDWYFTTRENVTMGPFESQELAKAAVTDFVDFINTASPKIVQVFKGDKVQQAGVVRT